LDREWRDVIAFNSHCKRSTQSRERWFHLISERPSRFGTIEIIQQSSRQEFTGF
jgi:hypothetical protein